MFLLIPYLFTLKSAILTTNRVNIHHHRGYCPRYVYIFNTYLLNMREYFCIFAKIIKFFLNPQIIP